MIKGIYVTCNRKPGKPVRWYVYAFRRGPLIMTKVGGERPKLGPKEVEAYHAAIARETAIRADTMAGLIRDYRISVEWKRLAQTTRRNWTLVLDRIEAKWGKVPLKLWSDPRMVSKVVAWRNESVENPRKADIGVTVLRHMLEWGRLHSRVLINVAAGIPQLYDGGNRAEIIWTPEDMAALAKATKDAPHIMDGALLCSLTGLRCADLVALTWANVGDIAISFTAQKSSRRKRRQVVIPIIHELRTLLKELRERPRKDGVETVLVNSRGRSWSSDGFTNSLIRVRDAAGIVHTDGRKKHLHDMRGTFATKLILARLTDQEAAGILGWSPERVANIRKVYVDQARVIVALAERISGGVVNHTVNQSEMAS